MSGWKRKWQITRPVRIKTQITNYKTILEWQHGRISASRNEANYCCTAQCTLTASSWRKFRGSARKPHQNGRQHYFPDLQIWPFSSGILSSRPFVRYKLLNVPACLSQYVSPPDTAGFSGISAEKGRYLIHRLAPRILYSNSTGILFRPNNSSENSHAINVQKWERGHYPDNVDIFPTIWPCSR